MRLPDSATPRLFGFWIAGLYTSSHPFVREADDILDRLLQLAVDGQHGDAVHVRPDVLRKLERIVAPQASLFLLGEDGVDESLKRPGALVRQLRTGRGTAHVPSEHDAIVRWMRDGKMHVGCAHGFEAIPAPAVGFPGMQRLQAQCAEPFRRHGRQERRLVGEVAVQRGARHAELFAHGAQRQRRDPPFLNNAKRLLQERSRQVAVVVSIGSFSGHKLMVPTNVDNVNIGAYIDVDSGNIDVAAHQASEVVMNTKTTMKMLWDSDRRLTAVGVLMLALLAATGVALLVDPRQITGAPAWMKPAKFAASIAIYTLTLAWVFTYLCEFPRTRRVVSWVTTVTLLLEIVIIDLQAWRGTTSHFNVGTLLDGVLFTIMGSAILVQTITAMAVAVALWRQRFADPALGWALRLGMTITIVGAIAGGLMTPPTRAQLDDARAGNRMLVSGAHTVGAPDGGPGLPGTGWSREHGDIRVAHFLGLHALQILPLAALLFARRGWQDIRRVRMVWAIAASHVSLFALLLWQALQGRSVTAPDTALAAWAVLTAAALWLIASRSASARVHAVVY